MFTSMGLRPVIWLLGLLALFGGWVAYDWRQGAPEEIEAGDPAAPETVAEPASAPAPPPSVVERAGGERAPAPEIAATTPPGQIAPASPAPLPAPVVVGDAGVGRTQSQAHTPGEQITADSPPSPPAALVQSPISDESAAASGKATVAESTVASPPPATSGSAVDWARLAEIAPGAGRDDPRVASPAAPNLPNQAAETAEAPTPGRPEAGDEQRQAALEVTPSAPAPRGGAPTAPLARSTAALPETLPTAVAEPLPGVAEAQEQPATSLSVDSIRRALAALLGGSQETPSPGLSARALEPEAVRPSFDIVRVGRDGRTVVAGRAAPGAEVELRAGDRVLDRVRASSRGDWVATPVEPLAPGGQELSLAARSDDAAPAALSEQVLVVAVPEPPPPQPAEVAAATPVAVLLPKDGEARGRILQAPGRLGSDGRLALLVLDYDQTGQVRLSGEGPPGAPVRIYVDNQLSSEVVVAPGGQWLTVLKEQLDPGDYTLRLDQLGNEGHPVARLETPFTRVRQPPVAGAAQVDYVIVQPGNSLWRIARRLFGSGFAYTHIYDANHAQIRDPDLIYPGQVFEVPAALGSAG